MLKRLKNKTSLVIGSGLLLVGALGGSIWLVPRVVDWLDNSTEWSAGVDRATQDGQPNKIDVLTLAALPPEDRDIPLKAIAIAPNKSLNRSRARYLLASDLIKQYQGGPALRQLEGLEKDYPALAPYILLKRGRAYELTNENTKAKETWQKLLATYPNSPVVAEALYQLGKSEPQYWERAIAQYPYHPRTQEIIRQRLQKNPAQPQLMLLLAQYTADAPGMNQMRDRLVKTYGSRLKPKDWEVIATGYWEAADYKKAYKAYAKAPRTPRNLYRLARGLQLKDNQKLAKTAYLQLIEAFPNAAETGLALRRLASLSKPKEAVNYLNQAIRQFPNQAPEALLEKAKLLDALNSRTSADRTRKTLLTQYAKSDAAAEYRWQIAQRYAETGDLIKAWQWAQPITTNNSDSSLAPKAAFWIGKWAQQLGRQKDAQDSFEHVLGHYPQSYYAWRAAVLLGWDVGDFTTVRQITPDIIQPVLRPTPPAGSDSFKELYLLGQDRDAYALFEAETANKEELTVAEQFTDGLLRLTQNKNLQGISQILNLQERDDPHEQRQWQALRQTPDYWYALFPLPYYQTILNWSQQRQLNPLLVASLIRQESRFEPEIKSPAGAIGLMQVMPGTGQFVAGKIALKQYSLSNPDDNVNLGTWYLDYTHQEYNNNSLLAVASYNAGPGNVAQWLKKYQVEDPDLFVEKIPFRETKGYVESVFSNYWNYLRLYNPKIAQLISKMPK